MDWSGRSCAGAAVEVEWQFGVEVMRSIYETPGADQAFLCAGSLQIAKRQKHTLWTRTKLLIAFIDFGQRAA